MKKFSTQLMGSVLILLSLSFANHLYSQESYHPLTVNFLEAAKYEKLHPVKYKREYEAAEMNMQKVPMYLPTPAGAIQTYPAPGVSGTLNPNFPLPQNVTTTPGPNSNFVGATDDGSLIPPDGGGAVGPLHVFTAENHKFVIRTKAGVLVSSVSPATFFSGINPTFNSDPHVKFDQYSQRWIVVGQSAFDATSSLVIAVSASSDPTGAYFKYSVKLDLANANAMDYPLLGYNKNWIVVSSNMFNTAGTAFTGTSLFVFDKNNLYSGGVVTVGTNAFRQLNTTAQGSVACPMTSFSTGAIGDQFYLIQPWNAGTGQLRITQITGTMPALTWPANPVFVNLGAYGGGPSTANLAPQLGDARKMHSGDDNRICSFIERNGNFWGCHSVWVGTAPNDRTVAKWYQLTPAGTILQNGFADPGAPAMSGYSSLTVTAAEDMLIGYTRWSPTTYASAAYAYRTSAFTISQLDNEVVYHAGVAPYYKTFGGARCRWGDYSSTVMDPSTGSMWTVQEFADTRVGPNDNDSRFATWWAEVVPTSANVNRDALIAGVLNPAPGSVICNTPVNVIATLRNGGLDTLKTVSIGMKLDGVVVGTTYNFVGTLLSFNTQDIPLGPINPVGGGLHTLKVYTFNPNGGTDQRPANDTITITFSVLQTLVLPSLQGFETAPFPPTGGWQLYNPDGGLTWARTTTAARTGTGSMTVNSWNYTTNGAVDILETPKIDITALDSLNISFDVSYAQYTGGAAFVDTLQILYSLDCGVTWLPTGYKKWGDPTTGGTLGTAPAIGGEWIPTNATQWRNEKVNLPICGITSPTMMIGVKWTNNFGNDVYIDNYNIIGVNSKQRNAAVLDISSPFGTLCSNTFTPAITLGNLGTDTLKTATISYAIDGGALSTFNFTGALAKCSTQVITLSPITSVPGNHTITIYSSNPNGGTDQYTPNDTAKKSFTISQIVAAPIVEGFENTAFPPNGWAVSNPDGLLTWERTTTAAKTGVASMVIKNFNYPVANTVDKFISPVVINQTGIDSFFVSFDYAYAAGFQYPGATVFPLDTLELQITQDCGRTFTTIWKKWGEDLQTIGNPLGPNNPSTTAFTPQQPTEWRNARIFLSPVIGTTNFQVYFVAKSNKQNNLYIDNINIFSRTLPARLKNQGYLLYPSPFRNSFVIHHYLPPVDLQNVGVYNSVGQLVWKKDLNGQGNTEETVDLRNLSSGVYEVKLTYTNKTVVERVVKTN